MFQRKNALVWYVAAMALVLPGTTQAAELLTNGNFSSGLAGWTTFNTPNGSSSPMATTFDITGAGVQSAVGLRVGQQSFSFNQPAGGGLTQLVNFGGGSYTFSADWAALGVERMNASGGIFSLLVNNIVAASFNTGSIGINSVERGSLVYTNVLAAGSYVFGVQATRPFLASGVTQYFSNISLQGASTAVPEPSSWAMMLLGFGLIGFSMRRRTGIRKTVHFG